MTILSFPLISKAVNTVKGVMDPVQFNMSQVTETEYMNVETEYRAPIQIGSPPKTFHVLLDTGSTAMFVYSTFCKSTACTTANSVYNASESSTSVPLNVTTFGQYADGSGYSGNFVNDVVTLGDITLQHFQFVQVMNYTAPALMSSVDQDGIMGMGLRGLASKNTTLSFAESAIASKSISKGIFSYYIDVSESTGVCTLGGYNDTLFQNSSMAPVMVPMLNGTYAWAGKLGLPLVSSAIDGQTIDTFTSFQSQNSATATEGDTGAGIIDTGTSQAIVSYNLLDSLASKLNASGTVAKIYYNPADPSHYTYKVDCSLRSELSRPIITLSFAGMNLSITPMEYISQPQQTGATTFCQLLLKGSPGDGYGKGTYLIGNTFLKRYVSVFDYDAKSIGFQLAAGRNPAITVLATDTSVNNSLASASIPVASFTLSPLPTTTAVLSNSNSSASRGPNIGSIVGFTFGGASIFVLLVMFSVARYRHFAATRQPIFKS